MLAQPSCSSLSLEVAFECQLSTAGVGSRHQLRLSVVMTQMMRVAEWGTILVTCKTAPLKMQTLAQPEFNSVPGETKIFSHLFMKRKLINIFPSEALLLK